MRSEYYWNLFLNTGRTDAYINYKKEKRKELKGDETVDFAEEFELSEQDGWIGNKGTSDRGKG